MCLPARIWKVGFMMGKSKKQLAGILAGAIATLVPKIGFASIGSTGGGSTGGGGGSSSSGGDGTGSITGNYLILLITIAVGLLVNIVKDASSWIHLHRDIEAMGCHGHDAKILRQILKPNMTIAEFEQAVNGLPKGRVPAHDTRQLIKLYGQAQFAYGNAIRRLYTGQKDYLSDLQGSMGSVFLKTVAKEIRLKASKGIVDDTIISHGKIMEAMRVGDNVVVAKVKAIGLDREVNSEQDFDASFERQSWEDYVVFAKDKQTKAWKIYNLIYGEHFHLNGVDYNGQASLMAGAKYREERLPVNKDTLKLAGIYAQKTRRKKIALCIGGPLFLVTAILVSGGFSLPNLQTPTLLTLTGVLLAVWAATSFINFLIGFRDK